MENKNDPVEANSNIPHNTFALESHIRAGSPRKMARSGPKSWAFGICAGKSY
jgi:hypothetical protein